MAGGITSISVGGFKSIKKEQTIEIRPLTILAGANSSGKSSIMQPLLLMKQTLEQTFDPGPLWLGGPNVKFTLPDEMFSAGGERPKSFSVSIAVGPEEWHRVVFKHAAKMAVDIAEVEFHQQPYPPIRVSPGMANGKLQSRIGSNRLTFDQRDWNWKVFPVRCSVDLIASRGKESRSMAGLGNVAPAIHRVIHLPPVRGNRERAYTATAVPATFSGTFELYAASIIKEWQASGNERSRKELEAALKKLKLTASVEARQLDATQISVEVGRLLTLPKNGERDMVNIADVGIGVSQALPIAVALVVATERNLVYLEEPEVHLHPNAQFEMASLLAAAAKRGVRIVAETHSSILLRAVQTLVARGKLSPKLVKLHWFSRDKQGFTKIHSSDLDENGAFGDWPEDFDDIELRAQSEYLDAVEARQARS